MKHISNIFREETDVEIPDKSRQKNLNHQKIQTNPDKSRHFQTFREKSKFSRLFQIHGNPALSNNNAIFLK